MAFVVVVVAAAAAVVAVVVAAAVADKSAAAVVSVVGAESSQEVSAVTHKKGDKTYNYTSVLAQQQPRQTKPCQTRQGCWCRSVSCFPRHLWHVRC